MKILFVGNTSPESTSVHYANSFEKLGHTVTAWDPCFFEATGWLDGLRQRLRRQPTPSTIQKAGEQLVRLCETKNFDLVFVMGETFVSGQALRAIRALSSPTPTIVFHSHDNVFAKDVLTPNDFADTLAAYDWAFTTKSQNVARYRELGQRSPVYLPSAFEPTVHRPIDRAHSRLGLSIAVSFVGTYDRSRMPYLDTIGWHRLHVWGSRWNRTVKSIRYRSRVRPSVFGDEFADVCSRSRIALGLLRKEAEDRHTQRTFEIPACGAFQLAPDNEEIRGFFEPDREIVLFSSLEELRDKTNFYLKNDSARRAIAVAGHRRCLAGGHTYLDRTRSIIKHLGL